MTKPRFRIGSDGSNLRAVGPPEARASSSREETSSFLFSWRPVLRDARDSVHADYVRAAARAIDALQNSGWIAAAIDHAISSTIGADGLRLVSKPDHDALGWTTDMADQWARLVERRFEVWARTPMECDAAGRMTLAQMQRIVMLSYFTHGEALALLPMIRRPWAKTATKVKLMPAHKLVQDGDGQRMFQGVTMDTWGMPTAYRLWIRAEQSHEELIDIAARDGVGRPQVVHVFQGEADQVRGITPLLPVLRIVRQYDQLADATVTAALVRAIFAATVTSDAPTADILGALQDAEEQGASTGIGGPFSTQSEWHQSTKIDLGRSGRIAHLRSGETLEFQGSAASAAHPEELTRFLLREVACCLGVTFEAFTGHYDDTTDAGLRMASAVNWSVIAARRAAIPARFCQMVFDAWLEEEIESARIPFPGGLDAYLEQRAAATRADWRGPANPRAADIATQQAYEGYRRMGVMTDAQICAELGQDWEDIYEQRRREMARRQKFGLPAGDALDTPRDETPSNSLVADTGREAA